MNRGLSIMREIVMDTETTGFDPHTGDRLVEIGCVELSNFIPTGRVWHQYINPERDMPAGAFQVHGLSAQFLSDKPLFADVVDDFLSFVDGGKMIFHNAGFDMNFINAELSWVGRSVIPPEQVFDTLAMARRKHPAGPNSLDALCKRYGVDNSSRAKHGALLDAELLAEVYLHLIGGPQAVLDLTAAGRGNRAGANAGAAPIVRPAPLPPQLADAELVAHSEFVNELGENAIWNAYG
jgi:DNA polymerase-3 subunit epsilon